jgi:hypothetical protein
MSLDLRFPIGLMFSALGLLLAGYGFFSDRAIYAVSLGINVNGWWGLVMLVFGVSMLAAAWRASKRAGTT